MSSTRASIGEYLIYLASLTSQNFQSFQRVYRKYYIYLGSISLLLYDPVSFQANPSRLSRIAALKRPLCMRILARFRVVSYKTQWVTLCMSK